jgi:hypothetical protein
MLQSILLALLVLHSELPVLFLLAVFRWIMVLLMVAVLVGVMPPYVGQASVIFLFLVPMPLLAAVMVIARMARLVRPPLDMFLLPVSMLLLPRILGVFRVMLVFLVMPVLLMVVVLVIVMPP